MKGKEFVKLVKNNGWTPVRIRGSHYIMMKEAKNLSVPVHAGRDLPYGLLKKLIKQGGLK